MGFFFEFLGVFFRNLFGIFKNFLGFFGNCSGIFGNFFGSFCGDLGQKSLEFWDFWGLGFGDFSPFFGVVWEENSQEFWGFLGFFLRIPRNFGIFCLLGLRILRDFWDFFFIFLTPWGSEFPGIFGFSGFLEEFWDFSTFQDEKSQECWDFPIFGAFSAFLLGKSQELWHSLPFWDKNFQEFWDFPRL